MQGLRAFMIVLGVFAAGVCLWSVVRGRVVGVAVPSRKRATVVLAGVPVAVDAGVMEAADETAEASVEAPATTTVDVPVTVDGPVAVDAPVTLNAPVGLDVPAVAAALAEAISTSAGPLASSTTTKTAATAAKTATTKGTARQAAATARPSGKATTGRPKTATTRPSKKTTTRTPACKASVDNATPATGGNVVVTVTSDVPATPFTVTARYKSKSKSLSGVTNRSGGGSVTFDIGSATKGYTVKVDVNISGKASCSTEFTPR